MNKEKGEINIQIDYGSIQTDFIFHGNILIDLFSKVPPTQILVYKIVSKHLIFLGIIQSDFS